MISILNSVIIRITTLLPKSIVQLFSGKYVAGESHKTALGVVKSLNDHGFSATIDILGEHVKETSEATEEALDNVEAEDAAVTNNNAEVAEEPSLRERFAQTFKDSVTISF